MVIMIVAMIIAPVASISNIDAVVHRGWIAGRSTPDHADWHQAGKKKHDQGYGTPHDKAPEIIIVYRSWIPNTAPEGSAIIAAFPSLISGLGAISRRPPRDSARAATAATFSTAT